MPGTGIFARKFDEFDGYVQVGIANGRVISVSFPEQPETDAQSDERTLDWIEEYLAGKETAVTDVETGLTVPTDQRTVLETVRKIPYGEELPIKRLVARSPGLDPEDTSDLDLARKALADNPIPLFVPDHRVENAPSGAPPRIRSIFRDVEGLD